MFKVTDYDGNVFYGEDVSLDKAKEQLNSARALLHPLTKLKIIDLSNNQTVYMEN